MCGPVSEIVRLCKPILDDNRAIHSKPKGLMDGQP